jgi:ferredoxin
MPRIVIDRTRCIGAGQCVANAADHFTQSDEDGLSEAIAPATTEAHRAAVELAIAACPVQAISMIDDQ